MSIAPRLYTHTGRWANPLALRLEDIDIQDLAHGLSGEGRFANHTVFPISVAQHSVYVSRLVQIYEEHETLRGRRDVSARKRLYRQALLHDGSEAYLGDMTKWLKAHPAMAPFREAEDRAQAVIYERFGCAREDAPEIKAADALMVRFEGARGFGTLWEVGHPDYPKEITQEELALIGHWEFVDRHTAKAMFLGRFKELED